MARRSLTSVASLTTLNGLPSVSKIGLYEACIHTSLPSLPMRLYSPVLNSPAARCCQNAM